MHQLNVLHFWVHTKFSARPIADPEAVTVVSVRPSVCVTVAFIGGIMLKGRKASVIENSCVSGFSCVEGSGAGHVILLNASIKVYYSRKDETGNI